MSENLNHKCSADGPDMKRAKLDPMSLQEVPKPKAARGKNTFVPIYFCSLWQEPHTTRQCSTVVVLFPSGIGLNDFKVRVAENGECLDINVKWPNVLTDMSLLHKKWLQNGELSDVHPKILGFEASLKNSVQVVRTTFYLTDVLNSHLL